MIENKPDKEATKRARRAKRIEDPRSYISYAGHVYLFGIDRTNLREKVFLKSKGICAICGEPCPVHDGDMDHIKSGRPVVRCDCFNNKIADGTRHTNVQWVHGMFSRKPCHRKKHNREVKWTKR